MPFVGLPGCIADALLTHVGDLTVCVIDFRSLRSAIGQPFYVFCLIAGRKCDRQRMHNAIIMHDGVMFCGTKGIFSLLWRDARRSRCFHGSFGHRFKQSGANKMQQVVS